MSTITLPNIRVGSDLQVRVRLKDGGVAIDWSTLTGIKAYLYSDEQRSMASRCTISVDEEDSTLLVCQYAASKPQYLGVNRIVVCATYMGETKNYDKPALNFVRWTADQEGEQITIDDPDVDVEIEVNDVSSSILDEAIRAAINAAEEAVDAKGQVLETEAEVEAAEALRVSAEESRVEAEEGRAEAEAARVDEEAVRVSAEDARVVAENARAAAEDLREGAEDDRAAAETARETAEAARVAAEALRVTAEGSRETAEAAREAQASADHTTAASDHTQAAADHTQAAADHTTAASDHTQVGADHTLAAADHVTAGEDHAQAQDDHEVMAGYDTRLGNVEGEVSQLEAKVDVLDTIFDRKDITNQATLVAGKYILSGGTLGNAASADVYKFDNDGYSVLLLNAGNVYPGSMVAFYDRPVSEETFATAHCVGTVTTVLNKKDYIVPVPGNARCIAVCNSASVVASPSFIAYKNATDIRTILFKKRNEEAVTTTINDVIDVTGIPDNSQIIVTVDAIGGSTNPSVGVNNLTNGIQEAQSVSAGNKIYIQKNSSTKSIRMYKSAAAGNVFNYTIEFIPMNTPIDFRPFSGYEKQPNNTIYLGTFLQGRFRNSISDFISDFKYVSTPIQYKTGVKVRFSSTDYTNYVISLQRWGNNFTPVPPDVAINQQLETDFSECVAWSVRISKADNTDISIEEAMGILSVSYVSGTIYERSASVSDSVRNADDLQKDKETRYLYDEFCRNPFFYHFAPNGLVKDGAGHDLIAGQSEDDIRMASRLGFKWIEANINKTSDNKFFVMHPKAGGTFGDCVYSLDNTDISNVSVNSKTLAWVKQNVRFKSTVEKYKTAPLSIEEFCQICRECNMAVLAGISGEESLIPIIRQYMGSNFIVYGGQPTVRNIFKGIVSEYISTPTYTVDWLLQRADRFGRPLVLSLGNELYNALVSAGTIDFLISELHRKGYMVGLSYLDSQTTADALKRGIDTIASTFQINPFDGGIVYDINGDTSVFSGTGTIANNTATLGVGETLEIQLPEEIALGKAFLSLRFNGELTLNFGSISYKSVTSNGEGFVNVSDFLLRNDATLIITAVTATTITELVYKVQEC